MTDDRSEPDTLAARAQSLAETERQLDETERQARALLDQIKVNRGDALRPLDLAEVQRLDAERVTTQNTLDTLKELRGELRNQWAEVRRDKARLEEARWIAEHGPKPLHFDLLPSKLAALGIDGRTAGLMGMLYQAQQRAAEPSTTVLKAWSPRDLERAATRVSEVITLGWSVSTAVAHGGPGRGDRTARRAAAPRGAGAGRRATAGAARPGRLTGTRSRPPPGAAVPVCPPPL
jgi:hypothetical protein